MLKNLEERWRISEHVQPLTLPRLLNALRWLVPLLILLASALHESILAWLLPRTDTRFHAWLPVLVYSLTGTVAVWFGLGTLARIMEEKERAAQELREAYDHLAENHRRLLAMYDIGREIASAADLQHVLEMAARAPVSLLNARGAGVFTFDEEQNRLNLEMVWGLSDEYVRRMQERVDLGVVAERCRNCEILAAKVSEDCPLFEGMKDVAQKEGIYSLACLPFGSRGKRDGIITAYFDTPHPPPADEMYLLSVIAAEIAGTLESLRLRDRQMASMYAVEHLAEEAREEESLWREILEVTLRGWEVSRGAILIPQGDGRGYRWLVQGINMDETSALRKGIEHITQRVLETHAPYIVPDTRATPDLHRLLPGIGAVVGIPLATGVEILAVMVMLSEKHGYFRGHQAPFFLSVGYHAGLAVNNARLRERVEHLAAIEERYRISREIHDGLAQSLSFIGWRLDRAENLLRKGEWEKLSEELEDIRSALRDAYQDVREAIDGLRMEIDHPQGLAGALVEYARDFEQRTGIRVLIESDMHGGDVPHEVGLHLLRIVQEGLTNVRKHAEASQVLIRLVRQPEQVELEVIDNGRGFDTEAPISRTHIGLSSMRERVRKLGGTFTLVSQPGTGTRIRVVIPLQGDGHLTRPPEVVSP